jgi:hypothetical protein
MSNGLGAGFGGLAILVALVVLAGLLVATTAVALYWRHGRISPAVESVAAGLVGVVVVVAAFGIAALVDEAPRIAVLFGVTVGLPLVVVAGRARWTGAGWMTVAARSGMAWSLPFVAGVGALYVLTVATEASPEVMTGVAASVTTGGALLAGEYVRPVLDADRG